MADDYCGCVGGRCAWFTPARPALVLESQLSVTGWGEPRSRNPKRFEVGYGTGQEVATARLENRWLRRQLERCYLPHPQTLPASLTLTLIVTPEGKLRERRVTGAHEAVRPCVEEVI